MITKKRLFFALMAVIFLTAFLTAWALSSPLYGGSAKGAQFDGRRFHNLVLAEREFRDYAKWFAELQSSTWVAQPDAAIGPPPPQRVAGAELRVTHINHSTVLVQTQNLNILTDPIWSNRASPVSFFGPHRYRPPGINFADLPPIDAVIVSHSHYDHMDIPTLRKLYERDQPVFLVGLGNKVLLENHGIRNVEELDWWQDRALGSETRIHGVPAQHWSSRSLTDRNNTLWMSYVIETPGGSIYFAGDTGLGPHFKMIHERFGNIRLALIPIGAYLPRWFMKPVHLSPEDAIIAAQQLHAQTSVAIHYGTFRLGQDGQTQAPDELRRLSEEKGIPADRFWILDFGFGRNVSMLKKPDEH